MNIDYIFIFLIESINRKVPQYRVVIHQDTFLSEYKLHLRNIHAP